MFDLFYNMEFWDGVARIKVLYNRCRYPNQLLFGEFKEFDINQLYVWAVELYSREVFVSLLTLFINVSSHKYVYVELNLTFK